MVFKAPLCSRQAEDEDEYWRAREEPLPVIRPFIITIINATNAIYQNFNGIGRRIRLTAVVRPVDTMFSPWMESDGDVSGL